MWHEEHRILTPQYAGWIALQGGIVQINLDNCSIQRMEQLPSDPTLEDAEAVGLLPLVEILQSAPVALSAIGMTEMPDKWVAQARAAYQRFCAKFWPGHMDDIEATERDYDPESTEKKIKYEELSDGQRCTYGSAYIALLQMQNIRRTYSAMSPERQFEIYLHSMVALLDMVSAFEVEVAKHAFWDLHADEINRLPPSVHSRLKDMKENFTKLQGSLKKCKEFALNGAIDIYWLSGANLAGNLNITLKTGGGEMWIDNWVGTNDNKLYRIAKDIHSVFHDGATMKRLAVTREKALEEWPYWKQVDRMCDDIFGYRLRAGLASLDEGYLTKIDKSVAYLESELTKAL